MQNTQAFFYLKKKKKKTQTIFFVESPHDQFQRILPWLLTPSEEVKLWQKEDMW